MDLSTNENFDLKRLIEEGVSYLNFISGNLTLKHRTIVSFIILLLNGDDLRNCLKDRYDYSIISTVNYEEQMKTFLIQKINQENIPLTLKDTLLEICESIRLNFIQFLNELKSKIPDINVVFEKDNLIQWTKAGTVDKVKSIKELINYETNKEITVKSVSQSILFEFASQYCIEEFVSALWLSLSCEEQDKLERIDENYKSHLKAYWISVTKNESTLLLEKILAHDTKNVYNRNLSNIQNMVSLSICLDNPFSLKYFWKKLAKEEKETNLSNWISLALRDDFFHSILLHDPSMSILCFLISQLRDLHRQIEIIQSHSSGSRFILDSLLHAWPQEKYFLPTFLVLSDYLSPLMFKYVILSVTLQLCNGRQYETLLHRIWAASPLRLKQAFSISSISSSFTIIELLSKSRIQTAFMLLSEATDQQTKQIIYKIFEENNNESVYYSFYCNIVLPSKWKQIDAFLSRTLSSEVDILSFKLNLIWKYCFCVNQTGIENLTNKYLSWSFDLLDKNPYSNEIFLKPTTLYISLILFNFYDYVDKFLNWMFESKADSRELFTESLSNEEHHDEVFFLLQVFSRRGVEGYKQFEKFFNYSFQSSEAKEKFRNVCSLYIHSLNMNHLILSQKLDFVNPFINWYFPSKSDVIQFKNELLLKQPLILNYFFDLIANVKYNCLEDCYNLRETLKWFSLRKETLAKLKPLFSKATIIGFCNIGIIFALDTS